MSWPPKLGKSELGNMLADAGVNTSLGGGLLEILSTDNVGMWNTDKTAAVTVTVDENVRFGGRPSLRIDIPAGTSGVIKVGTLTANARVPYQWDRTNFALAVRMSNLSLSSGFQAYLGDSGYANFWANSYASQGNFPEQKLRTNEWWVTKPEVSSWVVGAGSPAVASQMRAKVQFTAVSSASNESIWIGFFGVMPKRTKPTIILTWDDGYASWYSFIAPLVKHYKLPISMGISSGQVGQANVMTASQIMELYNDPSNLFDIVNHSTSNDNYDTLGATAYYNNMATCRDYLYGLGIRGDGPLHSPLVQSVWGNDLVDLMAAGGFLTTRASAYVTEHTKDQAISAGDKLRWHLNICSNLQTGKSLAQAITDTQAVITANGFGMVNAHDFAAADGAYIWSYDNAEQYFGWLAAQRDAGLCEVKSWTRWYADLTGRWTDRK